MDVTVLRGNFGSLAPPRLASFVADDPDDLDDVHSANQNPSPSPTPTSNLRPNPNSIPIPIPSPSPLPPPSPSPSPTPNQVYSAGDTLTLGLDMRTDALTVEVGSWGGGHPAQGDRAYVDSLFGFSLSLGADYSGGWRDASTFVVTATDVSGAGTPNFSGDCVITLNSTTADPCEPGLRTNDTHPEHGRVAAHPLALAFLRCAV